MGTDPSLVDTGTGIARVLRQWAGTSRLRKALAVAAQIVPILLGAAALPAALEGSAPARVVFGVVVVMALAYKAVDVRLTRRDDPTRTSR